MNYKIVASTIAAATVLVGVLVLSFVISGSWNERALSLAFTALAITLGWLTGILATPYDRSEQGRFEVYTKAISLFLSGYALAKIDRVVERFLAEDSLGDPVIVFRLVAFLTAFLAVAILVFVYRQYALIDPRPRKA